MLTRQVLCHLTKPALVLLWGIEPQYLDYETSILPLNYESIGAPGRNRTDYFFLTKKAVYQ
jgi:hypothetical protein